MKQPAVDTQFDDRYGVLANKLGITDSAKLTEVSYAYAVARLAMLEKKALPGKLDAAHLRAIHRYIFQDVFPWAGDFRTVMTARGDSFGFPPPIYIEQSLDDLFARLTKENHLQQLDRDRFAERAGYYLGEINAVHAFRDGNGRAQREFVRTLALQAGHRLVWTGLTKPENDEASRLSFAKGDHTKLVGLIHQRLSQPQ